MGFRKFGFLAACLAGPGSAYVNGNRAAPARETSQAELVEKSTNGISPVPTSRPELAEVELFKRQVDYTLPFDYCGWYDDYKCMFLVFADSTVVSSLTYSQLLRIPVA
jgi:hypothetical protein